MVEPVTASRRALLATALASPALAQQGLATVRLLTWNTALPMLRDRFAAITAATGIAIRHRHIPLPDYAETALALFARGEADLAWITDAWLPAAVRHGLVAPLDGEPALAALGGRMDPGCAPALSQGGRLYALPLHTDGMVLACNSWHMAQAGIAEPPRSWQELQAQCHAIAKAGMAFEPMGLAGAADPWVLETVAAFVYASGGRFLDDAGLPVMTDPRQGIAPALAMLRGMIAREGIAAPAAAELTQEQLIGAVGRGEHAFAVLPSFRLGELNTPALHAQAGHIRLAPMPMAPGMARPASARWVRMYVMSAAAGADPVRRARAAHVLAMLAGQDEQGLMAGPDAMLREEYRAGCLLPAIETRSVTEALDARGLSMPARRDALAGARLLDMRSTWFGPWRRACQPIWPAVLSGGLAPEQAALLAEQAWHDAARMAR